MSSFLCLTRRRDGIGKPYALAPSVRENTTGQESIRYTRATDEVTAKKSTNVCKLLFRGERGQRVAFHPPHGCTHNKILRVMGSELCK